MDKITSVTFPVTDSLIIQHDGDYPVKVYEDGNVVIEGALIVDRACSFYRVSMIILRSKDDRWRFADTEFLKFQYVRAKQTVTNLAKLCSTLAS